MCSSVVCNTITRLCPHHHCPSQNSSPPPAETHFTWTPCHTHSLHASSPLLPPPVPGHAHAHSIFRLCGSDCCRYCIEWNHTIFPLFLAYFTERVFEVLRVAASEFLSLSFLFPSLVFPTSSPLPYRMWSCSWASTSPVDWSQDTPNGCFSPFYKKSVMFACNLCTSSCTL